MASLFRDGAAFRRYRTADILKKQEGARQRNLPVFVSDNRLIEQLFVCFECVGNGIRIHICI